MEEASGISHWGRRDGDAPSVRGERGRWGRGPGGSPVPCSRRSTSPSPALQSTITWCDRESNMQSSQARPQRWGWRRGRGRGGEPSPAPPWPCAPATALVSWRPSCQANPAATAQKRMGPNKNGPNWRQADKEEEEGRTGGWRGGGRLAAMLAMLMPCLRPSLPLRLSPPTPSQKTRPLADAHPATPTKQTTTPFLAAAPARRRSRSRSRSSSPLPVRQPAGSYACLISFRLRYACLPSWGCSGLGFWSAPPPRTANPRPHPLLSHPPLLRACHYVRLPGASLL